MADHRERPLLALLFSLGASLCYVGMSASVKALHGAVGTPETVFFRGCIGSVMGIVFHGATGQRLKINAVGVIILRVFLGVASLLCYYGAIQGVSPNDKGALATANLLLKTAPVWVALGAGFLLGERTSARTWIALAVGVAGAATAILGPTGEIGRGSLGLGALSGIFAAGAYLSVRHLAKGDDPLAIVTFFSMGIAVVLAPVVLIRARPLPDGHAALTLICVGGCGTTAQFLMTYAYRYSRAAIVAVSGLAEVAFTVAAAMIVFGERPTFTTFLGGGLAVVAGLVATWPSRQKAS